jgi:hypothetical protein
VVHSINLRFDGDADGDNAIATGKLICLYCGAGYFFFREVVQVISLISLKSFNIWLYDPSNYLNVAFVFLVTYWTVRMNYGTGDKEWFRIGAAISVTALWVKLLAYLRNMLIDFAVFVGGVFYVVRRLAAFLTALCVILIAFAQVSCPLRPATVSDVENLLIVTHLRVIVVRCSILSISKVRTVPISPTPNCRTKRSWT